MFFYIKKYTTMDNEQRVARAVELFKMGYNCAQSVTAAFADEYGYTEEQALKMSASFGGGIGRMRETCGAACGMFILAGLETGSTDPADRQGKADNYAFVQRLAEAFRRETGSLICAELLGLRERAPQPPTPEERTQTYYVKRPCVKMVEIAAQIWAKRAELE
jgi:C_GCAxxG_C_C family probable redox protein